MALVLGGHMDLRPRLGGPVALCPWVAWWSCGPDTLCRDIRVVERKDRTCGYWMVILILAIAIVLVLAL